jgi:hypothetical protein
MHTFRCTRGGCLRACCSQPARFRRLTRLVSSTAETRSLSGAGNGACPSRPSAGWPRSGLRARARQVTSFEEYRKLRALSHRRPRPTADPSPDPRRAARSSSPTTPCPMRTTVNCPDQELLLLHKATRHPTRFPVCYPQLTPDARTGADVWSPEWPTAQHSPSRVTTSPTRPPHCQAAIPPLVRVPGVPPGDGFDDEVIDGRPDRIGGGDPCRAAEVRLRTAPSDAPAGYLAYR